MTFNRDEFYVPTPPYNVTWHRHPGDLPGIAGPFMESYPALQVMIALNTAMNHDGHWLFCKMIDGYNVCIAGYSRGYQLQVAVNPRSLRPSRFVSLEEEKAYDDWADFMTRTADRLALAPYEQEQS